MSKLKYLITGKKLKIDYFIFEKMFFSLFFLGVLHWHGFLVICVRSNSEGQSSSFSNFIC